VIDLGATAEVKRIACPELDPADKRTLKARIARPAHWPEKGAARRELQAHVDRLELGQEAKIAAANRVIAEHERCRGADGGSPVS
jgi:hypothetical protein